jgi:hypothetical protein
MPILLRFPALLLICLISCRSGTVGSPQPKDQTRVRIENRASLDMDIYVRRNDGRDSRLGFAPGNNTTTFALPPALTAGASWVRFEAKPVRGSGGARRE